MRIALVVACLLLAIRSPAEDAPVSNLVSRADSLANKGDVFAAIKNYEQADELSPGNANILCSIAKCYCGAMHTSKDRAVIKGYAQKALDAGQRALKADPQSPKAHCCVAVCYAKQFPFSDNQTKVDYSRLIKSEAEKAIALDPKFDLAYHMLGRWNFEVSNMSIFLKGLIEIAYGGLPKASKDAAIDCFKKAAEIAPGRIIHHLQLARLYHATGQETLVAVELKRCASLVPVDMDDQDAKRIAQKVLNGEKWPDQF